MKKERQQALLRNSFWTSGSGQYRLSCYTCQTKALAGAMKHTEQCPECKQSPKGRIAHMVKVDRKRKAIIWHAFWKYMKETRQTTQGALKRIMREPSISAMFEFYTAAYCKAAQWTLTP